MLPLRKGDFPTSRDELQAALREGLTPAFRLPDGKPVVTVEGDYPALDKLHVDLTDAAIKDDYRPLQPSPAGQPGVTAAQFRIAGGPLRYEQAALSLDFSARDARFEFTRDARGKNLLNPVDANDGRLLFWVDKPNLEALAQAVGKRLGDEYDATVEKTEITLTGEGDRSVSVSLRVTAVKKIMLSKVRVTLSGEGKLTIDDQLNATLCGLSVEGEGMVGAMVVSLVEEEIQQWNGRSFSLTAFSLGKMKLRDLKIRCDNGLQVEAAFGS